MLTLRNRYKEARFADFTELLDLIERKLIAVDTLIAERTNDYDILNAIVSRHSKDKDRTLVDGVFRKMVEGERQKMDNTESLGEMQDLLAKYERDKQTRLMTEADVKIQAIIVRQDEQAAAAALAGLGGIQNPPGQPSSASSASTPTVVMPELSFGRALDISTILLSNPECIVPLLYVIDPAKEKTTDVDELVRYVKQPYYTGPKKGEAAASSSSSSNT